VEAVAVCPLETTGIMEVTIKEATMVATVAMTVVMEVTTEATVVTTEATEAIVVATAETAVATEEIMVATAETVVATEEIMEVMAETVEATITVTIIAVPQAVNRNWKVEITTSTTPNKMCHRQPSHPRPPTIQRLGASITVLDMVELVEEEVVASAPTLS